MIDTVDDTVAVSRNDIDSISKVVRTTQTKVLNLTMDDIVLLCDKVIDELKMYNIKIGSIYGIPRGGVIPAVILSYKLEIPLIIKISEIDKNTLIIDDVYESGTTMQQFKNFPLRYVLFAKDYSVPVKFVGYVNKNTWLVMPWELKESACIYSGKRCCACNKPIPEKLVYHDGRVFKRRFCSGVCRYGQAASKQISEKIRSKLSERPARYGNTSSTGINKKAFRSWVTRQAISKKLTPIVRERFELHPEKHPLRILCSHNRRTWIEQRMKEKLDIALLLSAMVPIFTKINRMTTLEIYFYKAGGGECCAFQQG